MLRGHNNIVYGDLRNFLYKNGIYKVSKVAKIRNQIVMSLDNGEIEHIEFGNRKHVQWDDMQDALTPSTATF